MSQLHLFETVGYLTQARRKQTWNGPAVLPRKVHAYPHVPFPPPYHAPYPQHITILSNYFFGWFEAVVTESQLFGCSRYACEWDMNKSKQQSCPTTPRIVSFAGAMIMLNLSPRPCYRIFFFILVVFTHLSHTCKNTTLKNPTHENLGFTEVVSTMKRIHKHIITIMHLHYNFLLFANVAIQMLAIYLLAISERNPIIATHM